MEKEQNMCDKNCVGCCDKKCLCGCENCANCRKGCCDWKKSQDKGVSGCIYGLAFIGAAIYFIQNAATFWMGVLGVLKALVWPAILIYQLLKFLGL
ncbi:MAG TPA: hypothetical protein PK367_02170 [Candidatus Paceibacterota bacterium]|nr:hypothetical protein [Candidatus Paceibacterota bacterium]